MPARSRKDNEQFEEHHIVSAQAKRSDSSVKMLRRVGHIEALNSQVGRVAQEQNQEVREVCGGGVWVRSGNFCSSSDLCSDLRAASCMASCTESWDQRGGAAGFLARSRDA